MSGMRNAPPISISSPRETGTSRPLARVLRISRTAAALLLTTVASAGPVRSRSRERTWSSRSPRRPVSRLISNAVAPAKAAAAAAAASGGRGARPRLVCSTVPVRLNTWRWLVANCFAKASAAASSTASAGVPKAAWARRRSSSARRAARVAGRPKRIISSSPAAACRRASTDGNGLGISGCYAANDPGGTMTTIEIPTLRTERLVLRALRADDLEPFAAMHANPEVVRHLGSGRTRSREETWDAMARSLGQWALRGYGMFAVEDAATGRFVGRTGILHSLEWPEAELAYGLDQPYWGRGLATESAMA